MAEVMVAFMLLSVISLILAGLIPATITGMARAAQRNTAGLLAESRLAALRQTGFSLIEPSTAPHETRTSAGVDFNLQVEVGPAPLSSGGNMDQDVAKIVTVTVRWTYRNMDYTLARRAVLFKHV
jgi:Tfp pilus assembly protein PilV